MERSFDFTIKSKTVIICNSYTEIQNKHSPHSKRPLKHDDSALKYVSMYV